MKSIHSINLSVFVKEGDDEEKIRSKLIETIPLDLQKEKIPVKRDIVTGVLNNEIIIYEIKLEKDRHTKKFLEYFFENLTEEQKNMILMQVESRIDEECHFFIRLEKEKLLNGEFFITDSGNCFHINILVAAYPAKKENAVEVVKKLLKSH